MLPTTIDILNKLNQHKKILTQNYSVITIGIFGSYATGNATEDSDIDIYTVVQDRSFQNIASLWNYLEKIFNKKVDLFYLHNNINPSLHKKIQNEIIYG